ncbi:hypothetical protein V6N11_039324 [Hibiscus sabdariffa]|uniref:Uncharacterized protein n=1 Tax=Hibiscus sabdariffa TaxID=183260 RepID=A0ABR2SMN3_9ROSI
MPNDGTNLLEVPGNRLPETGSRQMKILHIRGAWNLLCNLELRSIEARMGKLLKGLRHYNLKLGDFQDKQNEVQQYCEVVLKQLRSQRPRNNQGRMSAQIFQPRPKDEIEGRDIHHIRIFLNIPKRSAYQPGGRNKVKIKDLKPKAH